MKPPGDGDCGLGSAGVDSGSGNGAGVEGSIGGGLRGGGSEAEGSIGGESSAGGEGRLRNAHSNMLVAV